MATRPECANGRICQRLRADRLDEHSGIELHLRKTPAPSVTDDDARAYGAIGQVTLGTPPRACPQMAALRGEHAR